MDPADGDGDYGFDGRLEYLRPPFFPLIENDWDSEDWREISLPDWAR